jgi:hypothetical protein
MLTLTFVIALVALVAVGLGQVQNVQLRGRVLELEAWTADRTLTPADAEADLEAIIRALRPARVGETPAEWPGDVDAGRLIGECEEFLRTLREGGEPA